MKTPRDPLSVHLRCWRVSPPADPGFRAAIWARIRATGSRDTWPAFLRAHAAAWALVAVVTLSAAGYGGYATAQARVASDREAMVFTYLAGLDPRVQAGLRP